MKLITILKPSKLHEFESSDRLFKNRSTMIGVTEPSGDLSRPSGNEARLDNNATERRVDLPLQIPRNLPESYYVPDSTSAQSTVEQSSWETVARGRSFVALCQLRVSMASSDSHVLRSNCLVILQKLTSSRSLSKSSLQIVQQKSRLCRKGRPCESVSFSEFSRWEFFQVVQVYTGRNPLFHGIRVQGYFQEPADGAGLFLLLFFLRWLF